MPKRILIKVLDLIKKSVEMPNKIVSKIINLVKEGLKVETKSLPGKLNLQWSRIVFYVFLFSLVFNTFSLTLDCNTLKKGFSFSWDSKIPLLLTGFTLAMPGISMGALLFLHIKGYIDIDIKEEDENEE